MPDAPDILRLKECPQCGYDLAGLPREHACPECGFEYDGSMFSIPHATEGDRLVRRRRTAAGFAVDWGLRVVLFGIIPGLISVWCVRAGVPIGQVLSSLLFVVVAIAVLFVVAHFNIERALGVDVDSRWAPKEWYTLSSQGIWMTLQGQEPKMYPWSRLRSIDCRHRGEYVDGGSAWLLRIRGRGWRRAIVQIRIGMKCSPSVARAIEEDLRGRIRDAV